MNTEGVYICALMESLDLKRLILQELLEITKKQEHMLTASEKFSEDTFQQTIDRKEKLLKDLEQLDSGFESIYTKVKAAVQSNPNTYRSDIQKIQTMISEIMDCGVRLQSLEKKNKEQMALVLAGRKEHIKTARKSNTTAAIYYKNMVNQHQSGNSYFLDKKN